ncbi:MAG: DUF951 domain-containing protein [Actinomycetota bacterium]|nr:DUF951 domain-containing protein [Actinomycetota bacterium]
MTAIRVALDDVVRLKKAHPCGANEWKVIKLGMDVGLVCLGCGRELRLLRARLNDDFRDFIHCSGAPDH